MQPCVGVDPRQPMPATPSERLHANFSNYDQKFKYLKGWLYGGSHKGAL